MMPDTLTIVFDHRERTSGVPEWLGCDPAATLVEDQLDVGDY
jgi:ERCC4-type nuclease